MVEHLLKPLFPDINADIPSGSLVEITTPSTFREVLASYDSLIHEAQESGNQQAVHYLLQRRRFVEHLEDFATQF